MTARTVPPPDLGLPPLRDLVVHARRNLTTGLALSALAHLTLLGALLASRRPELAPRTVPGMVEIVPRIPMVTPPVTAPPSGATSVLDPRGIVTPTDLPPVVPPTDLPFRGVDVRSAGVPGSDVGPRTEGPTAGEAPAVDPAEGAFVPCDEAPVPLQRVQPEYPTWARDNGISGTVLLHVLVGQDGRVRRMSVIRGVTGLNEAAQEALRRWTFRPATANGRPRAVWVEIPVEFRLGG